MTTRNILENAYVAASSGQYDSIVAALRSALSEANREKNLRLAGHIRVTIRKLHEKRTYKTRKQELLEAKGAE